MNNYQPSGLEEKAVWDEHQAMLEKHKQTRAAKRELHKRTGGRKLKYSGRL
jgi:hypothetical protein